jgi:hypothetical protein
MAKLESFQKEIERLSILEVRDCGVAVPIPGDKARDLALSALKFAAELNLLPYQIIPSCSSSITLWFYDGKSHAEVECFWNNRIEVTVENDEVMDSRELLTPEDSEIFHAMDWMANFINKAE